MAWEEKQDTIAILYICTGEYTMFWKDFFTSCEKYFIPEMRKEYFVFTDAKKIEYEKENSNIHKIFQKNLGWPGNTLYRYDMFLKIQETLRDYEYIFFFNANVLFLSKITGHEFLPNGSEYLITTLHPRYRNGKNTDFTYERNPLSKACIQYWEGNYYAQWGINGWISKYFLDAMSVMRNNIDTDTKKNIIALWHDESHWNRYLFDHPDDVKILWPEYNQQKLWKKWTIKILLRNKLSYGNIFFKFFVLKKARVFSYHFWYHLIKQKIR